VRFERIEPSENEFSVLPRFRGLSVGRTKPPWRRVEAQRANVTRKFSVPPCLRGLSVQRRKSVRRRAERGRVRVVHDETPPRALAAAKCTQISPWTMGS